MRLEEKRELMDMLGQLASDLFKHLHTMDDEANTPAGQCSHAGLINYSIYKGHNDKKYEDRWNDNTQTGTDAHRRFDFAHHGRTQTL
jgi:hypothetical protein